MKTSDKTTLHARERSIVATFLFCLFGIAGVIFVPIDWSLSWPLVAFYVLLTINTFFSIRAFASIAHPHDRIQYVADFLLSMCMLLLPFEFNSAFAFIVITLFLFLIATFKYILLLRTVGFSRLLYKKIRIDAVGILFCFVALVWIAFGFSYITSIVFAGVFLVVNIYVLILNPLYNLDHHFKS
jgi:hypothetical protein